MLWPLVAITYYLLTFAAAVLVYRETGSWPWTVVAAVLLLICAPSFQITKSGD